MLATRPMDIERLVVGEYEANCYLIQSGNELVIIDPGDDSTVIIENIKKTQANLKYIINTHYHDDHTTGNREVKEACGGEILIHQLEKDYIDFEVDRFLEEGDVISFGEVNIKVLHTPGHSAGSICLLCENCIFTGDTVFLNGCGRVDLIGGSEIELEQSLFRLSKIIKPGMTVYSGHGEGFLV